MNTVILKIKLAHILFNCLTAFLRTKRSALLQFTDLLSPKRCHRRQTGKAERSKAQENCKNPAERMAAGVRWWLLLGSQHVPVRHFSSWTGSVLVNRIYGVKECLRSNMLCGFVRASTDPSAAAGLLPQLVALTLLQHLPVNYLSKAGIILPAGCQLVSV